jgi:hypothetical protein
LIALCVFLIKISTYLSKKKDGLAEERNLCEEEKLRTNKVIGDLERATTMEEISLRQKLRALWLREGDKCTKFFY